MCSRRNLKLIRLLLLYCKFVVLCPTFLLTQLNDEWNKRRINVKCGIGKFLFFFEVFHKKLKSKCIHLALVSELYTYCFCCQSGEFHFLYIFRIILRCSGKPNTYLTYILRWMFFSCKFWSDRPRLVPIGVLANLSIRENAWMVPLFL